MYELPMMALKLIGINGKVELAINDVVGYPNQISYAGGYAAKGNLTIIVSGYSVLTQHYFTTGELYEFFRQLENCYKKLLGVAILENTEKKLELRCEFAKCGHVNIIGSFRENPALRNILHFEFSSDQTYFVETLSLLKAVYNNFGDGKGVISSTG